MSLYSGTNQIKKVFVGTQEVKQIYHGTNSVFNELKPIVYGVDPHQSAAFTVPSGYDKMTVYIVWRDNNDQVSAQVWQNAPYKYFVDTITPPYEDGYYTNTFDVSAGAVIQATLWPHGYWNEVSMTITLFYSGVTSSTFSLNDSTSNGFNAGYWKY